MGRPGRKGRLALVLVVAEAEEAEDGSEEQRRTSFRTLFLRILSTDLQPKLAVDATRNVLD